MEPKELSRTVVVTGITISEGWVIFSEAFPHLLPQLVWKYRISVSQAKILVLSWIVAPDLQARHLALVFFKRRWTDPGDTHRQNMEMAETEP